jgi:CBS domain containing-hemolysin-like protein
MLEGTVRSSSSKTFSIITFDDISAVMDAGAQAGVLQKQEHHFIENVFELEERTVPSYWL